MEKITLLTRKIVAAYKKNTELTIANPYMASIFLMMIELSVEPKTVQLQESELDADVLSQYLQQLQPVFEEFVPYNAAILNMMSVQRQ